MNIRMTPKRFFYLMCGINVILLFTIFAAAYYGNSLMKAQSEKLVAAKTQNQVIERQQIQLTQATKDIQTYNELNEISKSIVPQDKNQARTVREITKLAEESGIKLKQISFPASNLGEFAAPTTPTPAPAPEEGEATAVAPPVAAPPPISQLQPAEGIGGVYELQITVSSLETQPVPFDNFILFLEKLESNRRTAHVKNITVEPIGFGDDVSFILTLSAYVKP